jgi:tetratricopeptide (TPR) repeat protein
MAKRPKFCNWRSIAIPDHQSALLNLGKAYYELGQHDKAAGCFLTAYDNGKDKNPDHLYFAAVATHACPAIRPSHPSF